MGCGVVASLSPEGASVNSQGREPLGRFGPHGGLPPSPEGAAVKS